MVSVDPSNPFSIWAKLTQDNRHPLICHMLDVAAVARQLWQDTISPAARGWFSNGVQAGEAAAERWIAIWAGLHDLGKAAPAFQLQHEHPRYQELNRRHPHGVITVNALAEILPLHPFNIPRQLADPLAVIIGGHHGVFPRSDERISVAHDAMGGEPWAQLRVTLAMHLAETIGLPSPLEKPLNSAQLLWLAGLISVADWIGSDERFFPYFDAAAAPAIDLAAYWLRAQQSAAAALAHLGWTSLGRPEPAPFSHLFPGASPSFPVQQAVIDLADSLDSHALIIVEAPMGEGKTEAAFYLADHASVAHGLPGHYIGLPTRATSDQMYHRLRGYLTRRYPEQAVNLQLLHGQAALADPGEDVERLPQPQDIAGSTGWDGAPASVVAAEWFTQRKRGLLAPFGVGTVDQALLAVLQTRHVFVRLFGLAHKTVIIDEVHAYDTYMSALLERLLTWLAALGCRVVLLSATLPRQRRERLAAAYAEGLALLPNGAKSASSEPPPAKPYPRLTWITPNESGARHVGISPQRRKQLTVRWLPGTTHDALGQLLHDALANGGCAAVICNTVRSAQQTYLALRPFFAGKASDGEPVLDLLHARFLHKDREIRERRALARFGKDGTRPDRAVLVATQVIEQSLDLDFDLMVTELAPADLVLQRAGRLHRHNRQRPPGLEQPALWILAPAAEDGVPGFDRATTHVYDEHVLLRTWWELRDRHRIRLPDDIEPLVEAVYDDQRSCPPEAGDRFRERWASTWHRLERDREEEIIEAQKRWLKAPSYRGALWRLMEHWREEDAPDLHQEFQALTRLSDPSVDVVCLPGDTHSNPVDPDTGHPILLGTTPDIARARRLLRNAVTLTSKTVVPALLATPPPPSWKRSALLRHCRLIVLDRDRGAEIGRYRLRIDPEIGVQIIASTGEDGNAEL